MTVSHLRHNAERHSLSVNIALDCEISLERLPTLYYMTESDQTNFCKHVVQQHLLPVHHIVTHIIEIDQGVLTPC